MKVTGYENPIKALGGLLNFMTTLMIGGLLTLAIISYTSDIRRHDELMAQKQRNADQLLKEAQLQTAWAAQCKAIQEID